MNWFYAQDGQQAGPVEDGELDRLVQTGTINTTTLVWHSGMTSWQPYIQARSVAPAAYAGAGGAAAVSAYANAPAPAPGQLRCSECTRVFPADEVVQIEGLNVCADCKPIVLQKLREGVRPMGAGFDYAGFWIRVGATVIDSIILGIVGAVVGFIVGAVFSGAMRNPNSQLGVVLAINGLTFLIRAVYETFFVANYAATPGKMACGLQVLRADGSRLTFGRALGRFFAKILSGIILGIGFIMAAFDPEKRALHDQICDTRVVKKG